MNHLLSVQICENAIVSGCVWFLVGSGFSLIYSTTRFFHFAHGIVFTFAAYIVYTVFVLLKLPFWIAVLVGIGSASGLGVLINLTVYVPLRKRKSPPLVLLLASLGVYTILQNLISILFGDDTKTIRTGPVREGIPVFDARITPIQIVIIITSIILLILLLLLLKKTRLGTAIRAVSSNPELAEVCGIPKERIIMVVFAIGSAMAGIAGILVALDVDMNPTMGMNALMMGVVAAIIGGIDSVPGIVLGALLLGLAQNLAAWQISSQWQDAIAFAILLVFLLFKPEGFLGKKIKKAEV